MATVLVTGGAGFIGSHVASRLQLAGHEIVVLDDLSGGVRGNVPRGATFYRGSVADEAIVRSLFDRYDFEYVFHLAAYAAEGLSHFIRAFNYRTNLLGSMNLINAAVNAGTVKCFVFTSSLAVYGAGQLPFAEDMTPAPEDPYGISKLAVEQDLKCAHEMFGLPFIIFRPHNVYGERQNLCDPYRNVSAIFMRQALLGQPMTIFGDGEQTRAFSYVDSVAGPIAWSIDVPDAYLQTFNVGGGTPTTINQLASAVAAALGKERQVKHLDMRHEVMHTSADHARLDRVFGPDGSKVSLEEGLCRMAHWAKGQQLDPRPFTEEIEVVRNLPPSWRALLADRAGEQSR